MPERQIILSPVPQRRRRRPRRSATEGRALLSGWASSGLSQAAYARQVGIAAQRIDYWRRRLAAPKVSLPCASGFVEITPVAGRLASRSRVLVVEISNAVRIRVEDGFDPAMLRLVVRTLVMDTPC